MPVRRNKPYVWVAWIKRLLSGEATCTFAAYFKAQHDSKSYEKVKTGFNLVEWQMDHTELLNKTRKELEEQGCNVLL